MKKRLLLVILSIICIGALSFGLTACRKDTLQVMSSYEMYRAAFIKAMGTEDGMLSEEGWLDFLEGGSGIEVGNVNLVCGDMIVSFTDGTVRTLKNAYPNAGHSWDEGTVTTKPTCVNPGVITYTCRECNAEKKEIIDAVDDNHIFCDYEYDETHHWHTCYLCGAYEICEHDFGGVSKDGDVDEMLECECGIHKTVGEFYAYKVTFVCDDGVSVFVYDSQDYTDGGKLSTVAYSRSKTGELLKDGEGQVNFGAVAEVGYTITKITVTPSTAYKNFKGEEETGVENIYRITKITDELTVYIETEIVALNLPVVVINTVNYAPVTDKENYVNCSVSVSNTQDGYCFTDVSAGIRGRGNTTWELYPKKPYRIKFEESRDMFGWGKYKSWVLLAMYQDFSNIKDYAAFSFANAISNEKSAFVPNAQHVEVYLNGQYIGIYLLTDQIQENEGRTGVEDSFDENSVEVPFLVEWDEYAPDEGVEGVDWFSIYNEDSGITSYYAIKYPEAEERFTQAQFDYIKNYIITVNSLCHNPDVTQNQFEEYIDLGAFIDYYLIQELMGQCEINWKSIYMSKATGGKLVMGPVWDFDWAASGPVNIGSNLSYEGWFSDSNWFFYMLQKDWFYERICIRWNEVRETLLAEIDVLADFKSQITEASERNAILWDYIDDDPVFEFDAYYDKIIDYLRNRFCWIENQLAH